MDRYRMYSGARFETKKSIYRSGKKVPGLGQQHWLECNVLDSEQSDSNTLPLSDAAF
jgi:hypothetical protein